MPPGSTFGFLKVMPDRYRKDRKLYVSVLCCCGNTVFMRSDHLRLRKQCGCMTSDLLKWCKRTHGMSSTPEYWVWSQMRERCNTPTHGSYHNYGGRGIRVCERWQASFENFIKDMGRRPPGCEDIDRKDNNGDYRPDNCQWTTKIVNCRNTRKNVLVSDGTSTRTVAEWAEITGLPYHVIANRVRSGWDGKEAVGRPIDPIMSAYGKMQNRGKDH